jgi:nickel transport protein
MQNAIFIAGLILSLAGLLTPRPAAAHKALVFAYTESGKLMIEGGFSGGKPCINCPVTVLDAKTGRELASAKTDAKGLCSIPIPKDAQKASAGLKLVLNGGEGHRAEWLVQPDEYLGQAAAGSDGDGAASGQDASQPEAAPDVDAKQLRRIVNEALDAKLAPIKRELLKDKGPSVSEVLGGVGYLVGIAGVLAWAASRKRGKNGEERG